MSRALLISSLYAFALANAGLIPASAQEASGKKVALLIGVNKYDKRGFNDLSFAERDVEELATDLKKAGYEVQLLTGGATGGRRATLKNIQSAIETVFKGRTKADLVLIALAGHGLQIEVTNDQGKLQAESFFCPADAEQGDSKTMLGMGTLFAEIDRHGGGRNLVLVDACREDPTRGRGMDGRTVKTLPEGVAVLFGCAAGQKTYETDKAGGGHGVFFHTVLEGLRGGAKKNDAGEMTWNSLVDYVSDHVETDVERFVGKTSVPQTPNEVKNLRGRSPVILPRSGVERPELLAAAFDERTAKARQQDWRRYLQKSDIVDENSIGMKLVLIPPGEFLMGSTNADVERTLKEDASAKREDFDDEKQHRVRIMQPYYLGMHEVTVGQFRKFVEAENYKTEAESDGEGGYGYDASREEFEGYKPQYTWKNIGWAQSDNHPVVNVSWNDAEAFCKWLSKKERRTFRLATEAEWEYACRAGTTTRFHGGDDQPSLVRVGNVADSTAKAKLTKYQNQTYVGGSDGYVFTAPVGRFQANAFGLHDMHGNAAEWCQDWYRKDYQALAADDPRNDERASSRVFRGGAWRVEARYYRSAFRGKGRPDARDYALGFRVALVQPGK